MMNLSELRLLPDWTVRVFDELHRLKREGTEHGLNCATFTARLLHIATGDSRVVPLVDGLVPSGGLRDIALALQERSLRARTEEVLGEGRSMGFAAPGDVILAVDEAGRELLGLLYAHQIVVPTETDYRVLPFSNGWCAWYVGREG